MAYNNVFNAFNLTSIDALQGDHVLFMGAIMDAEFCSMFVNNTAGSLNLASIQLHAALDANLKAQFNNIARAEYFGAPGGAAAGSERNPGGAQTAFLKRRSQTIQEAATRSVAIFDQFRQQLAYARTRSGISCNNNMVGR